MKRRTFEHLQPDQAQGLQRRQLGRMALGAVALWGLAACGGGGGDSNTALNLREAYDRVDGGMNHEQVKNAVGAAPTSGSLITQYWTTDAERLTIGFSPMRDGSYFLVSAQWDGEGGGYLVKTFDPN